MAGAVLYVFSSCVLVFLILQFHNALQLLGFNAAWSSVADDSGIIVRTRQGALRGERLNSVQGESTYLSFKGIPYALPPIGELRFKPPQPPKEWHGVRDALAHGPNCTPAEDGTVHEDCLFLNVYTPEIPSKNGSARPVMVWIHDGGFTYGSGDSTFFGPDYLVDAGVVLVTVNYRLNILGFLSLGNDLVPGNMGLKDQVAALQWVKENIAEFGGDPENVTIFGNSAGGASVQLHLLSPLSKGLFHKAISQSGSPLNPWAVSLTNRERAFKVGEKIGCKTTSTRELLACLMKEDPSRLVSVSLGLFPADENIMILKYPFLPTVEPESEGSFLSEHPAAALSAGRFHNVPYIIGDTSREGVLGISGIRDSESGWTKINSKFEDQLPELPISTKEFTAKVRDFYFRNETLSEENRDKYIDFYSDFWFKFGVYKSAKEIAISSTQSTYFYLFKFDGSLGLLKRTSDIGDVKGPGHGDELGYLFESSVNKPNISSSSPEARTRKSIVKLWTNFAKTGNPTPGGDQSTPWKAFGGNYSCYFSIDSDLSTECDINMKHINFWDNLY